MNTITNAAKAVVSYVGWLLLACTLGFYVYGIYYAIDLTLQLPNPSKEYPDILASSMSSLQAILLTNLGVVLGISIVRPSSTIGNAMRIGSQESLAQEAPVPPTEIKDIIQLFAVLIFLLGLIACSICWAIVKFKTNPTECVPIVYESGKMFVGVFLAYVAALLR